MSVTHVLVVTGTYEEDLLDEREYRVECSDPKACEGFQECPRPHSEHGDAEALDYEPTVFHGVEHTYEWEFGWCVPVEGCILQRFPDAWEESASDLNLPAGRWLISTDWQDGDCYLDLVKDGAGV